MKLFKKAAPAKTENAALTFVKAHPDTVGTLLGTVAVAGVGLGGMVKASRIRKEVDQLETLVVGSPLELEDRELAFEVLENLALLSKDERKKASEAVRTIVLGPSAAATDTLLILQARIRATSRRR